MSSRVSSHPAVKCRWQSCKNTHSNKNAWLWVSNPFLIHLLDPIMCRCRWRSGEEIDKSADVQCASNHWHNSENMSQGGGCNTKKWHLCIGKLLRRLKRNKWNCKKSICNSIGCFMGKIFISRVNPMTFRILQSRKDKPSFIIDVHYNRKDRLWSAVWLPSAAVWLLSPL